MRARFGEKGGWCLLCRARDAGELLDDCVKAVEDATGDAVRHLYRDLAGKELTSGEWPPALYTALSEMSWYFR